MKTERGAQHKVICTLHPLSTKWLNFSHFWDNIQTKWESIDNVWGHLAKLWMQQSENHSPTLTYSYCMIP